MDGKISLCVNSDILDEYEENFTEYSNSEVAHNVVETIVALPTAKCRNMSICENQSKQIDAKKFKADLPINGQFCYLYDRFI